MDDEPTEDDLAAAAVRLRDLLENDKIILFHAREAATLRRIAVYFDAEHDPSRFAILEKVIAACQSMSMIGFSARLLIVTVAAMLGILAALAQLAEKVPFIDRIMHWQSSE